MKKFFELLKGDSVICVQRDFNVGIQISGRSYYVLFSAASDVCLHRTDTDVLRKQD